MHFNLLGYQTLDDLSLLRKKERSKPITVKGSEIKTYDI